MTSARACITLKICWPLTEQGRNTMSVSTAAGGRSRSLILTAMIFAVAMTFIDQTIVSIAAPKIQADLGLSSSGMQWAINAYLLALAALFALGGRLADTVGHRTIVVIGVFLASHHGLALSHHLRRLLVIVRIDAQRRGRVDLAGGLPRAAGRGRGPHVPGCVGHRGADLRSALPRPGPGPVLW